jgi:hypothetical protein
MSENIYTVGDLGKSLALSADDAKLSLDGELTIYRVRHWTDGSVFIEFKEPQASLDEDFKKASSHIKVAFTNLDQEHLPRFLWRVHLNNTC